MNYNDFVVKENSKIISKECKECRVCVSQCAFLQQYGTPGKIAKEYLSSITKENNITNLDKYKDLLEISYQCSLCGLCSALCPLKLSPDKMFLEIRREAVNCGIAPLPQHKPIIAYEKTGTSKRYSWYSLPDRCKIALFPGCTFTGTRSDSTLALYDFLKTKEPTIGIVLDCCCKPSHDLGRTSFFNEMFGEMRSWLIEHGVETIIVLCPNCYKVFKNYGSPLQVVSVYEHLLQNDLIFNLLNKFPAKSNFSPIESMDSSQPCSRLNKLIKNEALFSIHDPCVLRNEPEIQNSIRELVKAAGFKIKEMPHNKKKTLCCGEGGSVGFVAPEFSSKWGEIRRQEAKDNECNLITYCAGCAGFLNKKVPTDHIIDALFYPESVAAGNRKVAKAPFTYLNRIRLKKKLRKEYPAAVIRERDFMPVSGKRGFTEDMSNNASPDNLKSKGSNLKRIIILLFIAAAVVSIRFSGVLDHFDSETLRKTVADWGIFAPVIYILIYTVAPVLFLPGLPITIVGGIIFGPVWGVIYTIAGATAGASLAFLISRYVARDWIKAKLTGSRWRELDNDVELNGWKIVAFTRLVPLFPFNLLNYAFGLTSIKFIPYAVTSFISMLPACIAFVVFSSSLLDLLRGNVSKGLVVGIALIFLVALIPMILKKRSKNS
ncbi:MAG: VTT domain-containing protein [Desulfamplus sp.]|nr:VTT domain-containing protein [Desulfamplus sp.]